MKQVVLDFETFYDDQYSLRKMTPVEYILDPRFEVIGCAIKEGDAPAFWVEEAGLRAYLAGLPEKVTIISHNALFDMCILAWRFGYQPKLMIDTLGMARAWLRHKLKSLSLASVALHYGVGVKGTTVHQVKGMGLVAIKQAGFYEAYAGYSCTDADLCWQIYRRMISEGFPVNELAVMDTVIRCATQPRFVLNQTHLAEHLHATVQAKQDLLARCGLSSRDDLMSNDKFAAALTMLGVDPPRKISRTTGQETWAFAKTDPGLIELEEHDSAEVQALVAARVGLKTTLEETRTQRLISISNLTWQGNQQGLLPMPLQFSGAHTHRLSGDWNLNMQNLPSRKNTKLRDSIEAPPGYVVVAVDASQIEARINGWFCGQQDMVDAFARGEDIYSEFASIYYGYAVSKALKRERLLGKVSILGLGYNMGAPKFKDTARIQSDGLLDISIEEATQVVGAYRAKYRHITEKWKELHNLLPRMTGPLDLEMGPLRIQHERIWLPNGLYLRYHNLRNEQGQWLYDFGGRVKYLYGGKLLENIIQALARIHVMDAAVRARRRLNDLGVWLNLQVHDELVYVVPEELAKQVEAIVMEEMRRRPVWGPGIPLDAEGAIGPSFGQAK